MLQPLVLPDAAWSELSEHALSQGLEFLSTPFDLESAELLAGLGMEIAKVPSGELTNLGFLRDISAMFDKVLLSTGMATLDETEQAILATAERSSVALMHCISSYPAPNDQLNLLAVSTLRERFGLPVGWSDHSVGIESAPLAVALGAKVLEKHITLDRRRAGPDHAASADAETMVGWLRPFGLTERMLGDGVKSPQPCEADVRLVARRSWHAARDLPIGHTLSDPDLVALRPGSELARLNACGSPLEDGSRRRHDARTRDAR
jgi:N,N'-diacetyllegionaminate synthase